MIEMHAAKEIKGTVVAPPSSDLFFLSLSMALVTGCATRVSPFRPTPRTLGWIEAFNPEAAITVEQDSCFISPGEASGAHRVLRLPYADIPYRDFIVFMLFGALQRPHYRSASTPTFSALGQGRVQGGLCFA